METQFSSHPNFWDISQGFVMKGKILPENNQHFVMNGKIL